jgi:Xaa-Pro aminopeptidase
VVAKMSSENLLIVADSEHDADMLYAVGMFVPDPFIYLRTEDKCHIVMSDLEIDRARKEASHCRVLGLSRYERKLRRTGLDSTSLGHVIHKLLRERRVRKVTVPMNFPHGIARQLRGLKIKVRVKEGSFFPEREAKAAAEVKKVSAALIMAEVGLSEGIQALKNSKIGRNNRLLYHGVPLTADKLRSVMDIAVIQAGGLANHTIVACGAQGCDPHERGRGVLRAHEPIILDIFPRSQRTGYFGDISRTVVRGRASEAVRRLYRAVARAQELAFEKMLPNTPASEVHQVIQRFFKSEGFKTGRRNGRMEGFFHGTGHGLGLEIHEAPRITLHSKEVLRPGHVVTVEPGLYYPRIGGVRLEDVALITQKTPRNLTKFEKVLEI